MARINVYVPDRLYQRAKRARLNVSELSQRAIRDELIRKERMQALEAFLSDLATRVGPASSEEIAAADAWAIDVIAAAERGVSQRSQSRATKTRRSA